MDADAGWETMLIPPDCERVPSAGVVAGSPNTGKYTVPIPPVCERVPGCDTTAGVIDAGWKTMPVPPDHTHIPGAGVAAGALGPNRETMTIPSDCECVAGNGGYPFLERFYVDDGILVKARFSEDGRRLRHAIESLALDHFRLLGPRGPCPPPPVGSA